MALYSVELLLEIDAPPAAAAALAILEARRTVEPLTVDVYRDPASANTGDDPGRCWERVVVGVHALEGANV